MCKIMQDLWEEGLTEGKARGRAEGRAEGKAEGRAEGKAEGRIEGKVEGKAEGIEETALNMLKLGKFSHEDISMCSGLALEKIRELAKKVKGDSV